MLFKLVLILALHIIYVLSAPKEPLLTCYICMESIKQVIPQKCDENKPEFHSCIFSRQNLLNWHHVSNKSDSEVSFRCLLLHYEDRFSNLKSLRGCVAEYPGYKACDHIKEIGKYKEIVSCELCTQNHCNIGFLPNEDSSTDANFITSGLVLISSLVAIF